MIFTNFRLETSAASSKANDVGLPCLDDPQWIACVGGVYRISQILDRFGLLSPTVPESEPLKSTPAADRAIAGRLHLPLSFEFILNRDIIGLDQVATVGAMHQSFVETSHP